jgi:hypothetical protein
MEDFSKPVSPYRDRGRGNYVPRTIFNPAADVLAGIEYVEGTFKKRRDKVNLFQQQAEQRRIDMQKLVNDTQRIDQTDAMAKMTDQFSNMVTDIYKADIASFDGDRNDYLVKANNAKKVIGDFGKVIGTVNELSNKYLDMNPAEQKKMVLRNQFIGENGDKRKAYMEFLNDPSKMNIRIQGEDIIITNNGKDLFNGTQLLNSVKDGNNLVEMADDYTEQIGAASKDAMSGIKNLVVAKQYEGMSDDGSRTYTTAKNDYLGAVNQYKKNLENSDKIDALLNESTFQRYIDGDENYNSQKHDAATKEAIIEQLIIKEFPMYDKEKGTAIGDKKISSKPTPKEKNEALQSALKYKGLFTKQVNSVQGILDAKEPVDKVKKYIQVMNTSRKLSGKDLLKYDEDAGMVFIEIPGKGVDSPSTTEEWASFDQIADKSFYQLLDEANINRGDKAIPTGDFSILLGDVKQLSPTETVLNVSNQSFVTDPTSSATTEAARNLGLNLDTKPEVPIVKNIDDFYAQELGATVQYDGKLYIITGDANSRSLTPKKTPKK